MSNEEKNRIADNVSGIPFSPIRKFFDIVNEMKEAISLGIGEPDFITPWHIRSAAIQSIKDGETSYSSNAGTMELRREISRYMKDRFQLDYSPEHEILVTVGASEAIDLSLRALINPGDEVIIPDPSYVSYMPNVCLVHGVPVALPTYAKDNFRITPEQLKKAITPRTKALILPYPNNPTGAVMLRENLEAIAPIIEEADIMVISDEIYSELTYSGRHASIASIEGMKERTILINGFSKSFAMTGWRVGFICTPPEIMNAVYKIHQYTIMCASTMSQAAACEAMRYNIDNNYEDIVKMRESYDMRRRYIFNAFNKMGLDCFEPMGAFYVFPCIKSTGLNSDTFCERLLREKHVAVVPGSAFGQSGEGYVRCSYAASLENIKEAMKRIESFVNQVRNSEGKAV